MANKLTPRLGEFPSEMSRGNQGKGWDMYSEVHCIIGNGQMGIPYL